MKRNQLRIAALAGSALLGVAIYQNCAPIQAGKFTLTSTGPSTTSMSASIQAADLSWSVRGAGPELNRFQRAERWGDLQKSGFNLYPPFFPNTQTLNFDQSGVLDVKVGSKYLLMNEDSWMTPAVADVSQFVFDSCTILFLVRDLVIPAAPATLGPLRIFSLAPSNKDAAGILVLDASAEADGSVTLTMMNWFDGSTYAQKKIHVTTDELKGPLAIAARFDKSAGNIQLAVNGRLSKSTLVTAGSIPPLGEVARTFVLHAPVGAYGSKGSFDVGDIGIYRSSLSDADLVSDSAELAANWSATVEVTPGASPTPGGTPSPSNGAQLYATNCQGCHQPLATSTRKGITLSQLDTAINSVSSMSGLASLSEADRQSIVTALSQ